MENIRPKNGPSTIAHLTRIKLRLAPDESYWNEVRQNVRIAPADVRQVGRVMAERAERVAAMMELMADSGFVFEADKMAIYCYSSKVEAYEIKRDLLAAGFKDLEFQIVLDFARLRL